MMHIFSALQDFYRTLSDLPHADRGDPEDANSDGEDHLPDCARYMLINLGGGAESWIRWARKQAIAAGALVDGANEETPHCELAAAGARGRRPGRGHYPQAQPRRDVPGERLQAVLREHSRSAGSDQAACVLAAGSKRSQPSQPSGLLGLDGSTASIGCASTLGSLPGNPELSRRSAVAVAAQLVWLGAPGGALRRRPQPGRQQAPLPAATPPSARPRLAEGRSWGHSRTGRPAATRWPVHRIPVPV